MALRFLAKLMLAGGFLLGISGLTNEAPLATRSALALIATGVLLGLANLGQTVLLRNLWTRREER